ncbi:MAG: hypothetical protein QOE61_5869 [Micromonosporaceae bacterium]|jgi:hypothetical protein|nr:hypothetical protein [Micromonosporaceae bacterium]
MADVAPLGAALTPARCVAGLSLADATPVDYVAERYKRLPVDRRDTYHVLEGGVVELRKEGESNPDLRCRRGDRSNALAILSSPNAATGTPYTSSTAHSRAHSLTRTSDVGLVKRFAINASITCPCVTRATSRIGHNPSMISAIPRRREKSAVTGNAPNTFCNTGATAYSARPRRAALIPG